MNIYDLDDLEVFTWFRSLSFYNISTKLRIKEQQFFQLSQSSIVFFFKNSLFFSLFCFQYCLVSWVMKNCSKLSLKLNLMRTFSFFQLSMWIVSIVIQCVGVFSMNELLRNNNLIIMSELIILVFNPKANIINLFKWILIVDNFFLIVVKDNIVIVCVYLIYCVGFCLQVWHCQVRCWHLLHGCHAPPPCYAFHHSRGYGWYAIHNTWLIVCRNFCSHLYYKNKNLVSDVPFKIILSFVKVPFDR